MIRRVQLVVTGLSLGAVGALVGFGLVALVRDIAAGALR